MFNLSFQKRVGRDIYETRASLLRKHQPQVDGTPLWHMKKFEKVTFAPLNTSQGSDEEYTTTHIQHKL
jgi:hypothetical protein